MKDKRPTVLVGMSGGVDSSVSAALLLEQGFSVVGGFIKNWSDSKDVWSGECQWKGERRDAIRVAAALGIPLLTFDFEKEYRRRVVDELFRGYEAGETPNPDVLCNQSIKFGLFLEEAKKLGIKYIATGHYARTVHSAQCSVHSAECLGTENCALGTTHLFRGADRDKDQSYFLYRVPQEALRMSLFPIGHLKKSEVRDEARRLGLPVAEKPDSQGICFIGKLDMEDFLRTRIPSVPGEITDGNGTVIGAHEGLDGFTIGQRAGIRVSRGAAPWYVAAKDLKQHRLIVVQGEDNPMLYRSDAEVRDLHWTRGSAPSLPLDCEVQVRYRQDPVHCVMSANSGNHIRVEFKKPVKAVTSGQSAVFYQGEECLGGGVIV